MSTKILRAPPPWIFRPCDGPECCSCREEKWNLGSRNAKNFNIPSWDGETHYVDWDFNGKNRSLFQFLQKPFILNVCKPPKKKMKISYDGLRRYSHIRFGIAWTGRINLKILGGYNINFQSIWPFVRIPCFPTEMVSKVAFFLSQQQNSHAIKLWLFCFWDQNQILMVFARIGDGFCFCH